VYDIVAYNRADITVLKIYFSEPTRQVEENGGFQRSSWQMACELPCWWAEVNWCSAYTRWLLTDQGKEREVMKSLWAGHWIQLWGRRYCHTIQLNIVPNVTGCLGAHSSWPQRGDQRYSLTYLKLLVRCA